MDPISAVGFAASILTFIDFSYKLVTGTLQVINDGRSTENFHTKEVVDDFRRVTEKLEEARPSNSEHEIALRKLAGKCQTLSGKLNEILLKLIAEKGSTKWEAVKVAFRSLCKKGEVAEMVALLGQYRSKILTRLSLILNERQLFISLQIKDMGEHVEKGLSQIVDQLKELQGDLLSSVKKSLGDINDVSLTDEDRTHLRTIEGLKATLDSLLDSSRPPTPETRVLRQLYFPSLFSREDSVPRAGYGTFKWILNDTRDDDDSGEDSDDSEEDSGDSDEDASDSDEDASDSDEERFHEQMKQSRQEQSQARSTLLQWLSSEKGFFHISGKAGSGKSTLMKLIAGHSKTQRELEKWAGDKKLIFAQFFAWRAGDEKQQTLHGLYQSILFSILIRHTDLIPLVFPTATSAFNTTRYEPYVDEPYFRLPQLHEGLKKLIAVSSTSQFCLCFLIDGLDEFKNDIAQRHGYADLAKELSLWAQSENVKLLVSSRPEPEFGSLVPDKLRIHLHRLAKPDIMKLGRAMFEKHHTFECTRPYYLKLVDHIVIEARGVFIWVLLMILELRNLADAGEDSKALQKFLDESPSLDDLYEKLLESINPLHRHMVYKMLFIVLRFGWRCPIFAMTWIDELFAPTTTGRVDIYPEEERARRRKVAEFRVAQTKGLLEIAGSDVDFFHRTAYDFFKESQEMHDLSAKFPGLRRNTLKVKGTS
ncbi:uncharacterized protein DNG_05700 [Cephalotrichum gorgonifer]|uniref:Nephrocystin 3-like N-terminal domain-containing protein n=1 Tax=Cephalotrichum gorgonifer TaxID=2041049 RepID=A0AAE8N046_9PEZI|nr:uncharacterized protein DNG_05700 [Cephalotrichum gorgonifer]